MQNAPKTIDAATHTPSEAVNELIADAPAKAAEAAKRKAENKAASAKRKAAPAKRKPAAKPKAPAKPKAASAPKADKAAERAALATRIAAERTTANAIFAQADKASVSIPVKPLSAFARSYKQTVTAHAIGRKPSPRQAAALAVAATASGVTIADKAKFARKFDLRGATYAIENGALSDAIASGLCSYDSNSETITLLNAAELRAQCGSKAIKL